VILFSDTFFSSSSSGCHALAVLPLLLLVVLLISSEKAPVKATKLLLQALTRCNGFLQKVDIRVDQQHKRATAMGIR